MKTIPVCCGVCGKSFNASRAEVQRGSAKFCSLSCSASRKRTNPNRTNANCALCTKAIWVRPAILAKNKHSFCSRVHKETFYSRGIQCALCKMPVHRPNSIFCSNTCQMKHKYTTYIERWLAGQETGNRGTGRALIVSKHVRHYLIDKAGGKCSECGWSKVNPTSGKVPLTIDHIDGDASRSTPDNLVVLCPNCHALTPTYGALNRGKGRTMSMVFPAGLKPAFSH